MPATPAAPIQDDQAVLVLRQQLDVAQKALFEERRQHADTRAALQTALAKVEQQQHSHVVNSLPLRPAEVKEEHATTLRASAKQIVLLESKLAEQESSIVDLTQQLHQQSAVAAILQKDNDRLEHMLAVLNSEHIMPPDTTTPAALESATPPASHTRIALLEEELRLLQQRSESTMAALQQTMAQKEADIQKMERRLHSLKSKGSSAALEDGLVAHEVQVSRDMLSWVEHQRSTDHDTSTALGETLAELASIREIKAQMLDETDMAKAVVTTLKSQLELANTRISSLEQDLAAERTKENILETSLQEEVEARLTVEQQLQSALDEVSAIKTLLADHHEQIGSAHAQDVENSQRNSESASEHTTSTAKQKERIKTETQMTNIAALHARIADVEATAATTQQELDAANAKHAQLTVSHAAAKAELATQLALLQDTRATAQSHVEQLEQSKARLAELQNANAQSEMLKQQLHAEWSHKYEAQVAHGKTLEARVAELDAALQQSRTEQAEVAKQVHDKEADVQQHQGRAAELQAQIDALTSQLVMTRSTSSQKLSELGEQLTRTQTQLRDAFSVGRQSGPSSPPAFHSEHTTDAENHISKTTSAAVEYPVDRSEEINHDESTFLTKITPLIRNDSSSLQWSKQLIETNSALLAQNTDLKNALSSAASENRDLVARIEELNLMVSENNDCIIELTAKVAEKQAIIARLAPHAKSDTSFSALKQRGSLVTSLQFHSPEAVRDRSRPLSPTSMASMVSSYHSAFSRQSSVREVREGLAASKLREHETALESHLEPDAMTEARVATPEDQTAAPGWASSVSRLAAWWMKS